jgi:hypothetical protein
MKIDLQQITDAEKEGHVSMHQKAAEEIIANGGVVYVSKYGTPLGKAETIEQLNKLLEISNPQNQ